MSVSNIAATLISDFSSASPAVVSQVWASMVQRAVRLKEDLSKFEKEVSEDDDGDVNAAIVAISNPLKKAGNQINITVESDLVGDRQLGETSVLGAEETLNLGTYSVTVDEKRHGLGLARRFEEFRAAKSRAGMTKSLTSWEARFKQEEALLSLVLAATDTTTGKANNLIWSGGGSADTDLTAGSTLNTSVFEAARTKMSSLGALPCESSVRDGVEIPEFYAWPTTRALDGLKSDLQWIAFNQNSRGRENGADANNPLITGSRGTWDGISAFEMFLPDHDNQAKGAVGSPLEPRAFLRTAISSTSTTSLAFGGSSGSGTAILYVKHFPGYDYLFHTDQTTSADSTTYYLRIYNMPGSTDSGLSEVVSYTGSDNNGNAITVVSRNAFGLGTKYSGTHDAGSLVVQCSANGIPFAFVPFVGRRALVRGYGNLRSQIDFETQDYKAKQGAAIVTTMGQSATKRADGVYHNFILAKVAINPLS